MKTYKDILRNRWHWGSLFVAVSLITPIVISLVARDERWLVLCIPFLFVAQRFFPVKCPNCSASIFVRPGPRAFDDLNYCQRCGFDLNTPVHIATDSSHGLETPNQAPSSTSEPATDANSSGRSRVGDSKAADGIDRHGPTSMIQVTRGDGEPDALMALVGF